MKIVGLVGGIAPESTVDYYRSLIAAYRARVQDDSYPSILINSIDLTKMLGFVKAGALRDLADYLTREVTKLAAAGADFAVLASNTPHVVFDDLRRRSPIPMISIVEATCEEALSLKLKRVGLFGTQFTMQGQFYSTVFGAHGIAVIAPDPEDQRYIHAKYMGELVNGIMRSETRDELLAVAGRMRDRQKVEGVILGGTELPLILRDASSPGIQFLDTTSIHVKRMVSEMLS